MSRTLRQAHFRTAYCLVAIAFFMGISAPSSTAQTGFRMPAMRVLTDADAEKCHVTAAAAEAAVKSAMRYNRMEATDEAGAPFIYVSISGVELAQGGDRCALSANLSFRSYELQPSKFLGTTYLGRVVYCERGAVISWDKPTAQTQVNNNFKNWVDECVLEIEQSYASAKRAFH
jgi:hypothetical protein